MNASTKTKIISGADNERLVDLLNSKLITHVKSVSLEHNHVVVDTQSVGIASLLSILKIDADFHLDFLVDITAIDWCKTYPNRFQLIYHLLSLQYSYRLRIKVWVPGTSMEVETATGVYAGANFMEREVWDMYGIKFKGHPDLRRILMYDEFQGHPLQKDYPLRAKQPRIPLLHPEVTNSSTKMKRPEIKDFIKQNPQERT